MRNRTRFITIIEAEPGMTLGADVNVVNHGILRLSLKEGAILTELDIRQLSTYQAEYIFIVEPDSRVPEQVAVDVAKVANRVMEIFSGADLTDPMLAKLFNQVILYRSA
ncbi:MAG: hypothetical protein WCT35_02650 [Sideroxydans sp.]|jgi:hypothetical protein